MDEYDQDIRQPVSAGSQMQALGNEQFTMACDWGENWGRIALTDKTSGAEILIVVPFAGNRDLPADAMEQQLCEQARPHLNKAVRSLISKSWPDE